MTGDLYHVEKISGNNIADWNKLLDISKQHALFMRDDYLSWMGYSSVKFLIYKKGIPFAGLCIPICDKTGIATAIVPYAPYQGLVFSKSDKVYSDYHSNLEAVGLLLDYIYDEGGMKKVSFSNSISVKDIRAVQWHHYHRPELGMYNITLRYTALKDISGTDTVETGLSKGRRLDYRYSKERHNLSCYQSNDLMPFMDLYLKTFARQGIELDDENLLIVEKIVRQLIKLNEGELWYAMNPDGKIIDATFIVYDKDYAYYLFGANDPEYRNQGGGTLLLVEQMKLMKDRGVSVFDFIGVNSPQRGDFKLSFGSEVKPYYICEVSYK